MVAVRRRPAAAVFVAALAAVAPGIAAAQRPDVPADAQDTVEMAAPEPVPGASLTVHLITVGPGDRVEEMWGHNALLVRDTAAGVEETYNYGLFDMNAPGFLADFYWGRGDYMVGTTDLQAMLSGYRMAGRRVWAQELALDPAAKIRLLGLLRAAVLPQNRFYRYNYYLNNCSTKVRDILDLVLEGQLRAATDGDRDGADGAGEASRGTDGAGSDDGTSAHVGGSVPVQRTASTWRHHTRRLAAESAVVYLGIQLLMGPRGDESTSGWDDMWIPMKLRDTAGALVVEHSDGRRLPLVRTEELWEDADREYPATAPPSLDLLFLLSGVLGGVILSLLGHAARRGRRIAQAGLIVFACAWGVFGLATSVLIVALHWTEHTFTYWNQNFLLFSPLAAPAAAGLIRTTVRGTTSVWGRRFALATLALAVVALVLHLIPPLAQGNRETLAFALPIHLGLCWVMLGVHRMDDALVYS